VAAAHPGYDVRIPVARIKGTALIGIVRALRKERSSAKDRITPAATLAPRPRRRGPR